MKISKILIISLVFLGFSIYGLGPSMNASAEEDDLVAQLSKTVTTPKPKTQFDCKMVEGKDKDGKAIVKLIGKDCGKVGEQVNAEQQKQKVSGVVCCVCEKEMGIIICRGSCCILATKSAFSSLAH